MKCEQLIGPTNAPRKCSVPATYTVATIDGEIHQHLCVMHARKEASRMDRSFWKITRDIDGAAL